MDEEKFRVAINEFFKEYVEIQERVSVLIMELKKKTPVAPEDYERAMKILEEEVDKTEHLQPHIKVLLHFLVTRKLKWIRKAPTYVA